LRSSGLNFVEEVFTKRRCFSRRSCQRCSKQHWNRLLQASSYRWRIHKCYVLLATSCCDKPT